MRYLHTMLRVRNLDQALDFYCNKLGLQEVRRRVDEKNRYTLVFLAAPEDEGLVEESKRTGRDAPLVELTYNWDSEDYGDARYFGHLAYEVDDIYAHCCRKVPRCRPRSRGSRCRTPANGEALSRLALKFACPGCGSAKRSGAISASTRVFRRAMAPLIRDRYGPGRSRLCSAPLRHSASKARVNALMACAALRPGHVPQLAPMQLRGERRFLAGPWKRLYMSPRL